MTFVVLAVSGECLSRTEPKKQINKKFQYLTQKGSPNEHIQREAEMFKICFLARKIDISKKPQKYIIVGRLK